MTFARKLRLMRAAQGLSQEELADMALTSPAFVSHIETGKLLPNPALEARLRKALHWGEVQDKLLASLERHQKPA